MSPNLRSENRWYQAIVVPGKKMGRFLSFPTINLFPSLMREQRKGVYASRIKIKGHEYFGVLYYGPRLILGETKNVLEIYVFDFNQEIYGETVSFQPQKYIRGVMNFTDTKSFQAQLQLDCQRAREFFSGDLH